MTDLIISEAYHTHAVDNVVLVHFDPGPHRFGLAMNLANVAVTQYAGYNFNSFCKIGTTYVGANEKGLFTLGGDQDAGINIVAYFELLTSDFGNPHQKRIRKAHIGYEADGTLTLVIKNDDGNERSYTLTNTVTDNYEHSGRLCVGRDGKGRYWMFRFENTDGCDFSIDAIDVVPVTLHRKPSGG